MYNDITKTLTHMNKNVTITFHSMFVRGDGDSDVFGLTNPGELYYTIKVLTIDAVGSGRTKLQIERPKENQLSIAAGQSITEFIPGNPLVTFTRFMLPDGSRVQLSALIGDDDDAFFSPGQTNLASNSREIPTNFSGTATNQVLRIMGNGLDIDLIYSVSVEGVPEEGLMGVEMFTLVNFNRKGISQLFQAGEFPRLRSGFVQSKSVKDDTICSVKVGKGFTVQLFKDANFSTANGTRTLTSSVDDLGPDWNNQISSFIVNRVAP